jgi:sigma-B regulation protein RsbU (phosphoserine phosphatase)
MERLGALPLSTLDSIVTARKKVRSTLALLQADGIVATRTAACVSQVARRYLQGARGAALELTYIGDSIPKRMELAFVGLDPTRGGAELSGFFDEVRPEATDGEHRIIASLHLNGAGTASAARIEEARSLLAAKSRDELIAEVKKRNSELQESLENLRRTRTDKERMESELNIGHDIQMNMLPMEFPPFPDRHEFSIYAKLKPAREVGGDFYDFFFIDADHLCLAIGDVSGKGVPSALFAAVTKTLLSSFAKQDPSPASVVTRASDELSTNNESCMFVTLLLGILNVRSGKLVYTNAGHNPPYIKRADGTLQLLDERHGPIAGAMEGFTYAEGHASLQPGDLLYLFTDGVVEATNLQDELYSDERLAELLRRQDTADPETIVGDTIEAVNAFEGDAPQFDDITILALRFAGADMETAPELELTIQNDLKEIARVIEEVEGFCETHGLPQGLAARLGIALDELLNNVISYAYDDGGSHEVLVHVSVRQGWIWLRVEDDGSPFNPFGLRPPNTEASIEDREIGGLGIHFVTNMMDEVRYRRLVDKNVVEVGKLLTSSKE